ncbi:MAG: alanine racemase [Oscillospiraceae bacterium]|nr:alanine racemase [Oscillospiraceae bacterium]
MDDRMKRTWAEISLGAIEHNYRAMRAELPDGCRFLGVVKADAYGHGAIPVAKRLESLGCDYLAVACLDEARQLRQAAIGLPILILGCTPPEYAPELAELDITQAVGSLDAAEALNAALEGTGRSLKVHLKLETGMGRTGFRVFGAWKALPAATAVRLHRLEAEGVFTHFCVSDGPEGVRDFTHTQLARFQAAVEAIETRSGHRFTIRHCTNSGAMHAFPETYMDMVRPGVSLYGMYPGPDRDRIRLIPAMTLKTRVACVERHEPGDTVSYGRTFTVERPSEIAVLPIGYADGLHRVLSNRLTVLVNGHRAPQVGRICMDMCMADVTDLGVKPGDEAEIFGRNMPIDDVAELAGTIHYELTCAVSGRVPRVYVD